MRIITGNAAYLGPWFCEKQNIAYVFGQEQYIGLISPEGEILAVTMYDQYNKANINMHIAAVPGKRWLNREFLWYCFHYPFVQLGVKRITGLVPSTNIVARKFDENIGFTLEATLKDAHPDGDLLVYCMTKDQCRWLTLKESRNGQAQRTTPTRLRRSS